jgi:predicted nucleotidyltransferase component of viral defense system
MTDKSAKNIAASVRQRLLNLRHKKGEDYNGLLTQYAIERFLYRLSKSSLASRFVLKEAMLIRAWSGELHRPTKDLDLLGQGESTPDAVAEMVCKILQTPVPDDGLIFDADTVVAAEIREEQPYGGIRVKLVAMLGNARIPMQIDVGFGDVITPEASVRTFPTLLDMSEPELWMYPLETVVAEKLEAAVTLGMTNSRMKDYYVLLVIFRAYPISDDTLAQAIAATFNRRQTELPDVLPPGLSDAFGNDDRVQRLWGEFLRRLQLDDAPIDFAEVVSRVRDRIWPVVVQAGRVNQKHTR